MGIKFTFHAHGIFSSSKCIPPKCYIADNKKHTKNIPKGRFQGDLLYFSKIKQIGFPPTFRYDSLNGSIRCRGLCDMPPLAGLPFGQRG